MRMNKEMGLMVYEYLQIKNELDMNSFNSLALKMPHYVRNNGLEFTVWFLGNKEKLEHKCILELIEKWISSMHIITESKIENGKLADCLMTVKENEVWMLLNQQVLQLMEWAIRISGALKKDESNHGEDKEQSDE